MKDDSRREERDERREGYAECNGSKTDEVVHGAALRREEGTASELERDMVAALIAIARYFYVRLTILAESRIQVENCSSFFCNQASTN